MGTDEVQLLFQQFISLRQSGYGRNDAWFEIEATVKTLLPIDQKRLTSLLQQWEKQNAAETHSPEAQSNDPNDTKPAPPDGWEQARQHAAEERRKHVIRRIAPGEDEAAGSSTEQELPAGHGIPCPQCHKMNPVKSAYCYSCGMPMGAANTANATRPLDKTETDNAYFDEGMVLFLKVQGSGQTLRITPGMAETILGRKTPESVMVPDVDLSPFEAGDHGVSRLHANLRREANTIVMTDLGSRNHTHINGQRLHAHEVRVLHDGDEIRLGMYVYFGQG